MVGRAKNPHRHTHVHVLRCFLEESSNPGPSGVCGVCPQRASILSRYSSTFKEMVHQGSELKQKKSINPHPKRPDNAHYMDLVKQNEWLRSNVFNSLGNYLYCTACIRAALGVSKDRLARQHNMKCQQSQQPIVWRSQDPSTLVEVRYPHEHHGNAGRESNMISGKLNSTKPL